MMYLSRLLVDVGHDPDKHRPGRNWLRDIYAVHQRLCMAFPDKKRETDDAPFLAPHRTDDFRVARLTSNTAVREQRSSTAGLLFRIDPIMTQFSEHDRLDGDEQHEYARAMILVLSAQQPNWEYAFQNSRMLLAAQPEQKRYEPEFKQGERYRFRILMNLSQKISQRKRKTPGKETYESLRTPHPEGKLDKKGRPKSQGKRALLTWHKDTNPVQTIHPWFEMKAGVRAQKRVDGYVAEGALIANRPFTLEEFALVKLGWVVGYKPKPKGKNSELPQPGPNYKVQHDTLRFRSALLEGVLRVEDAAAFTRLALAGIGSAKAFGFGLLSLARMR